MGMGKDGPYNVGYSPRKGFGKLYGIGLPLDSEFLFNHDLAVRLLIAL